MRPPLSTASLTDNEHVVALPRLKYWRSRRLFTIEGLAKKAGVGVNTISRIENGHPAPRPSTVRKLAEALQVDPEQLMGPARRS